MPLYEGETLSARLARDGAIDPAEAVAITWARVQVARVRRQWQEVLTAVDESPVHAYSDDLRYRPWTLARAEAWAALGDTPRSRVEYEKARALITDSMRANPDDARYRVALGLAYAGLGRRADAIAEARQTLANTKLSEAGIAGIAAIAGCAEILVRAGAIDAAIEQLEILFTMPAGGDVSAALLRVNPTYDPLRADPRFQRLIQRYTQ